MKPFVWFHLHVSVTSDSQKTSFFWWLIHVSFLQICDQICLLMQPLVWLWGFHLHTRCQHTTSHVIRFFFNHLQFVPHRFHPDLKLTEAQVLSMRAVHLPAALRDCIQSIVTAAGHSSVTSAVSRLSLYLLIDRIALPHTPTYSCRDTLQSLCWQTAVTRYAALNWRFLYFSFTC